jgi:hypothetical protein
VSGLKTSDRRAWESNQRHFARARQVPSVFEDAGCGMASHHRCASVAAVCSCDPAMESEPPHKCGCGHAHLGPTLCGARNTDWLIETVPKGVL